MSAVVDAVSSVVSDVVDAVGSVAQTVVSTASDVLAKVDDAAHSVVNSALQDPIGTIAKVAAYALAPETGGASLELLPVISAADVLAHGGSLEDVAKGAALSYATAGAGNYLGSQIDSSILSPDVASAVGKVAAGTAAGVLTGVSPDKALTNALTNYAVRTGVNYGFNAAGDLVDQSGNAAPNDVQTEIASTADSMRTNNPTIVDNLDGTFTQTFDDGTTQTFTKDYAPTSFSTTSGEVIAPPETIKNQYGYSTQTFDDGSTLTYDENGNPVSATTTEGETVYPGGELWPSTPLDTPTSDTSPWKDAALNYLKNMFSGSLASKLLGSSGTTGTTGTSTGAGAYGLSAEGSSSSPTDTSSKITMVPLAKADPADITAYDPLAGATWGAPISVPTMGPYAQTSSFDQFAQPTVQFAQGGIVDHRPEFYSEGGASLANRYVKGGGDGTSDSVPAMLASGEFVIPADVVSSLGNGDNDAGAGVLDQFMAAVRKHKRAASPDQLPPDSKGPLAYLAEAQKKGKKHGRTK